MSKNHVASVARAVRHARRDLVALSRSAVGFDARRYFRGADDLAFHNVGASAVRLARSVEGLARERLFEQLGDD